MKSVVAFASLALAVLAAVPARAAPPPPVPIPPELRQPIDGYDLQIPYQLWRYWIENRKGAVIEGLLDTPPPPGERAFGPRQLRFKGGWEMGQFAGGDAQVYCKPQQPYGVDRDSCHIVLRQVRIPADAGGLGGANPLSLWMRENFDAKGLVRHFRAEGLSPETDWWRADRARLFAASASPDTVLKSQARIEQVDSRDCPAMAQAFAALDAARLDLRLDLFGVGADTTVKPPLPHSNSWTFTLELMREDGLAKLETSSRQVGDLVFPILKAAEACAKTPPAQQ